MTGKYRHLDALPRSAGQRRGFLYALALSDGAVKVGVSLNPRLRVEKYQRDQRRLRGLVVLQAMAVEHTGRGRCYWAERAALARMERIATLERGKEVFTGVHFGAAATLIRQMARRSFTAASAETKEAA